MRDILTATWALRGVILVVALIVLIALGSVFQAHVEARIMRIGSWLVTKGLNILWAMPDTSHLPSDRWWRYWHRLTLWKSALDIHQHHDLAVASRTYCYRHAAEALDRGEVWTELRCR